MIAIIVGYFWRCGEEGNYDYQDIAIQFGRSSKPADLLYRNNRIFGSTSNYVEGPSGAGVTTLASGQLNCSLNCLVQRASILCLSLNRQPVYTLHRFTDPSSPPAGVTQNHPQQLIVKRSDYYFRYFSHFDLPVFPILLRVWLQHSVADAMGRYSPPCR